MIFLTVVLIFLALLVVFGYMGYRSDAQNAAMRKDEKYQPVEPD